jgi:hypothetical protein
VQQAERVPAHLLGRGGNVHVDVRHVEARDPFLMPIND